MQSSAEKILKNSVKIGSDDVKSRVVIPAIYQKELKRRNREAISQELKDYKSRITDFMLAVFMLTAHEAWGIGAKRMATMCDIYADNLNEATDYIDAGINKEILENRLKQAGLWELYDYILNGEEK